MVFYMILYLLELQIVDIILFYFISSLELRFSIILYDIVTVT